MKKAPLDEKEKGFLKEALFMYADDISPELVEKYRKTALDSE